MPDEPSAIEPEVEEATPEEIEAEENDAWDEEDEETTETIAGRAELQETSTTTETPETETDEEAEESEPDTEEAEESDTEEADDKEPTAREKAEQLAEEKAEAAKKAEVDELLKERREKQEAEPETKTDDGIPPEAALSDDELIGIVNDLADVEIPTIGEDGEATTSTLGELQKSLPDVVQISTVLATKIAEKAIAKALGVQNEDIREIQDWQIRAEYEQNRAALIASVENNEDLGHPAAGNTLNSEEFNEWYRGLEDGKIKALGEPGCTEKDVGLLLDVYYEDTDTEKPAVSSTAKSEKNGTVAEQQRRERNRRAALGKSSTRTKKGGTSRTTLTQQEEEDEAWDEDDD